MVGQYGVSNRWGPNAETFDNLVLKCNMKKRCMYDTRLDCKLFDGLARCMDNFDLNHDNVYFSIINDDWSPILYNDILNHLCT